PLRANPVDDIALARERVTAPTLVIAAHEDLVGRLQEQDLGRVPGGAKPTEDLEQGLEVLALAHVHPEGDVADVAAGLRAELRERRDQGGGEIVHAEVAEVLEALDREALPRAGEPGDDHEADRSGGADRGRAHATGSTRP